MIKRIPALFFILVANIAVLSNIAIPHHHHNSEVCIVSTHYQADSETHKHGTAEHKHEHDGESNSDNCILNQVFVVPSNQVKQESKYLDFHDNWVKYNQFQANPSDQELIGFFPTNLYCTQHPLLFYSYCHYLNNGLGLRAPPIV